VSTLEYWSAISIAVGLGVLVGIAVYHEFIRKLNNSRVVMMDKTMKYFNCPFCGKLLEYETTFPVGIAMCVELICCKTYANIELRNTKSSTPSEG
jgi:hypothetical protein